MITRRLFVGALLVGGCVCLAYADQAPATVKKPEIRYIDVFGAMRESTEGQEIAVQLEKQRKDLAKNLEAEERKLTQAMTEYKSKASTMSDVARNKEEQKIAKMDREYKNKIQESEETLKLAAQQGMATVAQKVEKAVGEVAKKDSVDAVVDFSGRVVYMAKDSSLNWTDKVRVQMDNVYASNSKGPKPATALASNQTKATAA